MHKIEKELTAVTKTAREKGESEPDFLKRLQAKVDALPEETWGTLTEPTQKWANTAALAVEKKQPIPNFDGEIPAAEDADVANDGENDNKEQQMETTTKTTKKTAAKKEKEAAPKKTAKTAAEKAPSKKAAKAEKANGAGKRGRKGAFNDDSKITKVAKDCPFRDGSKAANCFKQYKVGRTVAAVLAAGVPRSKLARHANKGVITIAG